MAEAIGDWAVASAALGTPREQLPWDVGWEVWLLLGVIVLVTFGTAVFADVLFPGRPRSVGWESHEQRDPTPDPGQGNGIAEKMAERAEVVQRQQLNEFEGIYVDTFSPAERPTNTRNVRRPSDPPPTP